MHTTTDSIVIFTGAPEHGSSPDATMRGPSTMTTTAMQAATEITVRTLKDNMSNFLRNLDIIISASPKDVGDLRLDEVEIHAQIDSNGTIGIVGLVGAAFAAHGGIKFVLRKNNTHSQ